MWVGIDPSLTGTAIAIIDDAGTVTTRRCATQGHKSDSADDTRQRMNKIERWLRDQLEALGRIDLVVGIEGPSLSPRRMGLDHERAGLWWRLFSRACLYSAEQPVVVITPKQRAKYATGNGNAGKDAVLLDVSRRYPQFAGVTNDEADAFVIAAMLARLDGHPIEPNLPAPHLAALDKLKETP
ncbi:MAG: hypothetical protein Q4F65_11255 [Propionibacteriaceae bacterium]|nr:hypothetical protein [Propionibacteriaceae bacterium]